MSVTFDFPSFLQLPELVFSPVINRLLKLHEKDSNELVNYSINSSCHRQGHSQQPCCIIREAESGLPAAPRRVPGSLAPSPGRERQSSCCWCNPEPECRTGRRTLSRILLLFDSHAPGWSTEEPAFCWLPCDGSSDERTAGPG